jgi:hypothetical protein
MKKPLNEEVDRIKSIMGCCKGSVNEQDEKCVDPESPEGKKVMDKTAGYINYELKQLGIDETDTQMDAPDTPEVIKAKEKIADILNPILPNASGDELKAMIKEIKRMLKNRKGGKTVEPKPTQMNEQLGSAAAALTQLEVFLASIPTGLFVVVGAWLLLRLVRCFIYFLVTRMSGGLCGFDVKTNIFSKLMQLVFLDFRNLFDTNETILYGCDGPRRARSYRY